VGRQPHGGSAVRAPPRGCRSGRVQRRQTAWDVVGLAKRLCVGRLHQPADAGRSPTLCWRQRAVEANVGRQPHGGSAVRAPPRGCRSGRGQRQSPSRLPWVTMRAGALDRRSRGWARSGRVGRRGDDQLGRTAWQVAGLADRLCVGRLHQPADAGRSPTLCWTGVRFLVSSRQTRRPCLSPSSGMSAVQINSGCSCPSTYRMAASTLPSPESFRFEPDSHHHLVWWPRGLC